MLGNIESLSRHYADLSKIGVGRGCPETGPIGVPGEKDDVHTHENVAKLEKTPADGIRAIPNANIVFGSVAFSINQI